MLCFVPVLHGCVWYVCCYVGKIENQILRYVVYKPHLLLLLLRRLFSSVFAITERRDMGLYEVPLFVFLLGFGTGTMIANFHV